MLRYVGATTDFSETSRQAFGPAAVLARKLGMPLRLVHVDFGPEIHSPWQCASGTPGGSRERETQIRDRLDQLIEDEPAFQGLGASPRIIRGQTADVLASLHEGERIDLLVLYSRAHEDVKHFVPGSFAARALHLARCPVLILGPAPCRETFEIRRLLVAIDFSESSLDALEMASRLADAFQASLELLSVVETDRGGSAAGAPEPDPADGSPADGPAERTRRLEELAARIGGSPPARVVVRSGCPAEELLAEAARSEADLIVMGSRGLSPVEQITLGSVAERAIQNARCPVLVVKADTIRRPDGSPGGAGYAERADRDVAAAPGAANLSTTTCTACAEQHLACPVCKAHGG
jgi:nucleotide-binding universal stress UspA family protein